MPIQLLTESQIYALRQSRATRCSSPPSPPSDEQEQQVLMPPGAALADMAALACTWARTHVVHMGAAAMGASKGAIARLWRWLGLWRDRSARAKVACTDADYEAVATQSDHEAEPSCIPAASEEDFAAVNAHVSVYHIHRINRVR